MMASISGVQVGHILAKVIGDFAGKDVDDRPLRTVY